MQNELVLRPGKIKWGLVFLFCASLALTGYYIVNPQSPIEGWLCIVLGLIGGPFPLWAILSPKMRLYLSPAGFVYGTLMRKHSYFWHEVAGFGVSKFASNKWVVFTLAPYYQGEEKVRATNRRFGGFDQYLPDSYGMRVTALAELLEEWRLRYPLPNDHSLAPPASGTTE